MINVEMVLEERYPGFLQQRPLLGKTVLHFLRTLFHEQECRNFESNYPHIKGIDFTEQVLDYFHFNYRTRDNEHGRIPSHGRVIIIANHPIGTLDGLALLKLISEIRRDVKVVANEVLYNLKPLRSLLLPVDNINNKTPKENIMGIREHLQSEGALIIFPAGEVSRLSPKGVRDGCWQHGFLRIAERENAPIVPLYIDGRNSLFFYALSILAKPISTLWLIHEMFKQTDNCLDIRIGHAINPSDFPDKSLSIKARCQLFKQHIYKLAKGKSATHFEPSLQAIAPPENRQQLRKEMLQCELLGHTTDSQPIYLYQYTEDSSIMREIGRLREHTFRAVGEGTGNRRDIDQFDRYYDHLVLWDDKEIEIMGAYRMVRCQAVLRQEEDQTLYTQTLFDFKPEFDSILENGLELGRSFVQPRYWGKRSLDYLWFGIGAYLRKYPEIRHLYGPVSISDDYPEQAKVLLINFYKHYFGAPKTLATAKTPWQDNGYHMPIDTTAAAVKTQAQINTDLDKTQDYRQAFKALKTELTRLGVSVPTLYKQYTELCEEDGVQFAAFNVDAEFGHCVDGLIIVDLSKVKPKKRQRYIEKAAA